MPRFKDDLPHGVIPAPPGLLAVARPPRVRIADFKTGRLRLASKRAGLPGSGAVGLAA